MCAALLTEVLTFADAGREMISLLEANTSVQRIDLRGNRIGHMRLGQLAGIGQRNKDALAVRFGLLLSRAFSRSFGRLKFLIV